jgi:spore cortex biosynthesis protein YabQ
VKPMDIDVMSDLITFGVSILSGILIGILFDLYRAFRYFSKPKGILSYIEDFLFWIIVGVLFFLLLVSTTDGVLRGFVFIGSFSGGLLYLLTLSSRILSLFISIFKLILNAINEIIKLIKMPFVNSMKMVKKPVKKFIVMLKLYFKEIARYSKIISKKK